MNRTKTAEGEVVAFSAKCRDCRSREMLIEFTTPCHYSHGRALLGIKHTPPDCYDCKVKGLHHCTTTPSK